MSRIASIHGCSPSFIALMDKQQKLSVAEFHPILSSDCAYSWHSIRAYLYYDTDLVWNKPAFIQWDFSMTVESTQAFNLQPGHINLMAPHKLQPSHNRILVSQAANATVIQSPAQKNVGKSGLMQNRSPHSAP